MRKPIPARTCEFCSKTYTPVSTSQKFCCQTCANMMKKLKIYNPQEQMKLLKKFYKGEVFVLDESTWQWRPLTEAELQQRLNEELQKLSQ